MPALPINFSDRVCDHEPTATLEPTSAQAGFWFDVFGRLDGIPVVTTTPKPIRVQPRGTTLAYKLDLTRLTADEHERLVRQIARLLDLPIDTVEDVLDDGVPIPADAVLTTLPLYSEF